MSTASVPRTGSSETASSGLNGAARTDQIERAPRRERLLDRPLFRLAGFALALLTVFAGGAGIGGLLSPAPLPVPAAGSAPSLAAAHGAHDERATGMAGPPEADGLAVSREGYTLDTLDTLAAPAAAGVPGELVFRVLGPSGSPVTAFTPTHDKALHLIVVRRDQSGFQHLHPVLDPAGVWRTPITLAAGDHRLLADFAPDGRGEAMTLGRDLAVSGDYRPVPLPAPSRTATTPDGYAVTLTGALTAGTSSPVTLTVTKDGVPVGDLQPYLAAYGHLVALRTGDLAYLHVHPDGAPGDGRTPAGPDIGFAAEVPTPGLYRLYLDFAHQDVVRTVAFTVPAGAAVPGAAPAPVADTAPAPAPGLGAHDSEPAAPAHSH